MTTLTFPSQWDSDSVIEFVNQLPTHGDVETLLMDFTPVQFAKPFGTLIIADGVRRLVDSRKSKGLKTNAQIPTSDQTASSYLRHIGFFKHIRIPSGKLPGEALGKRSYVPIHVVTRDGLRASSDSHVLQDGVDKIAAQLTEVIYPRQGEQIMMQYCLREVIRNVFEHGETDSCTVLAQRYADGIAEIAIIDEGIGIHSSLSHSMPIATEDEALRLAMMPGVSRVTHPQGGEWGNSGFGLYIISELGRELGEFILASSGRYRCLRSRSPHIKSGELRLTGTAVKLVVNLEHADYFPNRLQSIVQRGEQEHQLEHGVVKSASKRSTIPTTTSEL